MCEWESESVESWGRRKRSLPEKESENNQEEDMNISQEILVLDFGDERQSTDFLRSDKPGGSASETNFGGELIFLSSSSKSKPNITYKCESNCLSITFSRLNSWTDID